MLSVVVGWFIGLRLVGRGCEDDGVRSGITMGICDGVGCL